MFGRKRKQIAVSPQIRSVKNARLSMPGTISNEKNIQNEKRKLVKSKKDKNPSKVIANSESLLETSNGFHDLEDVETWVCAVCQCYDPIFTSPVKNFKQAEDLMTTEWIGKSKSYFKIMPLEGDHL